MPDPNSDAASEHFLLSAPFGDILAARRVAVNILAGVTSDGGQLSWATLFLTAVLLQCAINDGEAVTLPALMASLNKLCRTGLSGHELSVSPMQFCRYAAAEIATLTSLQRSTLVTTILSAAAKSDPPSPREISNNNRNEVRS